MWRPGLILGLAVLVGSVLGACGSAPAPRSTAAPDRTTAVLDLVTDSGGAFAQDQFVLSRTEDTLVATCMRAKGRQYVVPTSTEPDPHAARASLVVERHERSLQPGEERSLQPGEQHSYGLFEQYAEDRPGDTPVSVEGSNDHYVAGLSAAERAQYLSALRGDPSQIAGLKLGDGRQITYPTHGCEAEARAQLYPDPTTAIQVAYVPQIVKMSLVEAFQQDSRYIEALTSWRTCMTAAGQKYTSPVAARRKLEQAYQKQGASADRHRQEIEVASQDQRCDDQVGLSSAAVAGGQSYLRALPAPDQAELQRLVTARLTAVETARRISNG